MIKIILIIFLNDLDSNTEGIGEGYEMIVSDEQFSEVNDILDGLEEKLKCDKNDKKATFGVSYVADKLRSRFLSGMATKEMALWLRNEIDRIFEVQR